MRVLSKQGYKKYIIEYAEEWMRLNKKYLLQKWLQKEYFLYGWSEFVEMHLKKIDEHLIYIEPGVYYEDTNKKTIS